MTTSWTQRLMRAMSSAYGHGASVNRELRRRSAKRLRQPVVSVGNIAVGGRNKTPVVAAIASLLHSWGERPAVLSRGYRRRRKSRDVVVVRDAEHMRASLDESGDEPYMLARELPGCCVVVHPDRYRAGLVAEQELHATVHILDDGFQHAQLARDANLVLLTLDDVLHGEVVPAGRLREPLHALADADALIAVDTTAAELKLALGGVPDVPVFQVRRVPGPPRPLSGTTDFSRLRETPVLLVTAVAEPARVADDLRRAGWLLTDSMAFPDHHDYTADDVRQMVAHARGAGAAALVTTAKDAVKLDRHLPVEDFPVAVVPVEVTIEPADVFAAWLQDRLSLEPEGA